MKTPREAWTLFYNSTKVIYIIQDDPLQNHSINSFGVSSSSLSETSPSVESDLQTRIRESSITRGEVPENQINNKNQSGNSAIKENTQHIHKVLICYIFRKLPSLELNLMLSKAVQLVKYQFSKQIRLSFVSFTQNIQNSGAK